jgi:rsbT co-antagonist protein RsbR
MNQDISPSDEQRDESTTLRRRIVELEQRVAELEQRRVLLTSFVENSPVTISIKDLDRRILLVNRSISTSVGMPAEQLIGKTEDELFGADVIASWLDHDRQVVESRQPIASEAIVPVAGGERVYISHKFPLIDADDQVNGLASIVIDITEQKRTEQERIRLQQDMIEHQRAALRELSTPLVPIADGVVAMPLVGAIDSARAQQIMEALLEGISERQAETAILDITGVTVVDTQVASALLRAAQAAQLLGARILLTGIGAEVAQALVHLGADLSRITTLANLQEGIAYALSGR